MKTEIIAIGQISIFCSENQSLQCSGI